MANTRKISNRSRVSNISWVPDTSRGSKSDVLIEAGSAIKAGSLIQAGGRSITCSNRSWELLLEVLRYEKSISILFLLKSEVAVITAHY